jgi:hypothetical protein
MIGKRILWISNYVLIITYVDEIGSAPRRLAVLAVIHMIQSIYITASQSSPSQYRALPEMLAHFYENSIVIVVYIYANDRPFTCSMPKVLQLF